MFGTRRCRCGSLATSAAPPVSAPPTAKPLLPTPTWAALERATARAPRIKATAGAGSPRRSNTDAFGIGTGCDGSPCIGASQRGDVASRKSTNGFGNTARRRAMFSSRALVPSWLRSKYIASIVSRLSAFVQGCGLASSSRYSHGRTARCASPALTPWVYASTRLRWCCGSDASTRSASARNRLRPDQCGQFARGIAALQVHLEKALLPMHVAECVGEVAAILRGDGGYAVGIAHDGDRRRQPLRRHRAVGLRAAARQQSPADRQHDHDDDDQREGDASNPAHGRSFGGRDIVPFT